MHRCVQKACIMYRYIYDQILTYIYIYICITCIHLHIHMLYTGVFGRACIMYTYIYIYMNIFTYVYIPYMYIYIYTHTYTVCWDKHVLCIRTYTYIWTSFTYIQIYIYLICIHIHTHTQVCLDEHVFCGSCLMQWLSNKNECPTCRTITGRPRRLRVINNVSPRVCKHIHTYIHSVCQLRSDKCLFMCVAFVCVCGYTCLSACVYTHTRHTHNIHNI